MPEQLPGPHRLGRKACLFTDHVSVHSSAANQPPATKLLHRSSRSCPRGAHLVAPAKHAASSDLLSAPSRSSVSLTVWATSRGFAIGAIRLEVAPVRKRAARPRPTRHSPRCGCCGWRARSRQGAGAGRRPSWDGPAPARLARRSSALVEGPEGFGTAASGEATQSLLHFVPWKIRGRLLQGRRAQDHGRATGRCQQHRSTVAEPSSRPPGRASWTF